MEENVTLDELTLISLMDHHHQKATTLNHTLMTRVLHSTCFSYWKSTTTWGFDLVMDLATNSNDLHFMILLMHSACTQHKCINTKHNISVKYVNIGNTQVQNTTKHNCAYNTSTQIMNQN